jgi:hypothetical protein
MFQMSTSYGIEKVELDSGLYLNNADTTVSSRDNGIRVSERHILTSVNDVWKNQIFEHHIQLRTSRVGRS